MIFSRLLALSTAENLLEPPTPETSLYEAEGYRWLCSSAGAVQSAMQMDAPSRLVLPNQRAMLLAALLPPQIASALDLGMGCGGFSRHLQAWMAAPVVTAVEASAAVVSLARRYFAVPAAQPVYLGDAAVFLADGEDVFDLVLCDLFRDRRAPEAMRQEAFYAALASRLSATGALALNSLPASADELKLLLQHLHRHFRGIGLVRFTTLGNVVILATRPALPDKATLLRRLAVSRYAGAADMRGWIEAMIRLE